MKTTRMMVLGLAAVCAMTLAGEAMARGGSGGGGGGNGGVGGGSGFGSDQGVQTQTRERVRTQTQTQTRDQAQAQSTARPADSQRQDGTFLKTGTTANGDTSRPAKGKGVQDGSGLTLP